MVNMTGSFFHPLVKNSEKELKNIAHLSVIHSGHQVLHEKHIEEILPALLH